MSEFNNRYRTCARARILIIAGSNCVCPSRKRGRQIAAWWILKQIEHEHDNDVELAEMIILPAAMPGAILSLRAGFPDPVLFRVSPLLSSARLGV
jgi:hypothetical protein